MTLEGEMAKTASKPRASSADLTIANYISQQIDLQRKNGKSQKQIAEELGYEKPNIISMFKFGQSKVPLDKIPALAKALNVDPAFLFRLAMKQYWKGAEETIAAIFGTVLTENEKMVIAILREATKDDVPAPTGEQIRRLKQVFK